MNFLKNKTLIITGASSGIGFELSKQAIQKYNAKVIGIARTTEKLQSTKEQLGENFTYFSMDVSKETDWENFAEYLKSNNISADILINNAGIMLPFIKATDCDFNQVLKVINIDLMSVLYSVKYIVPLLNKDKGLVNISSSASLCPVVGQSAYSLAKSAVKSYTEVMQTEADFYVGLMLPGYCKTNIMRDISISEKEKKYIDKVSISSEKCAKKILKSIDKKRQRKIIGLDAKFMNILYKLFPKKAGKIIAYFLIKSNFDIFKNIQ